MKNNCEHTRLDVVEARWKTYLRAVTFLLPAWIIWGAVSTKCVPILETMLRDLNPYAGSAGWFWAFSMFLVHYGVSVLVGLIAGLALLELTSHPWARHRRRVVGV